MGLQRPRDLYLVVGLAAAVLLGCVATWIVMDIRLKREREAMREEIRREMQKTVQEGIKGAADDMLTKEYVEKKVTEEAGKLLTDPPVEAVAKTAEAAADAGVKLGAKTATGVLKAVKENEKEIGEVKDAATDVARMGIRALLDAAKSLAGEVTPEEGLEPDDALAPPRKRKSDGPGDSEELPESPKGRR